MLPGFRFLFAAIVLTISTLVFGLGAAALLRASHEQFASLPVLPSAPMLPPTATADASSHDATPPTLALLRVDTPELEAAAVPGPVPAPVTDRIAPAREVKEIVTAPPPPDRSGPEPASAPAAAKTTDEVETAATASSTPETPQAAAEATVAQPEARGLEPTAISTDTAKAEPAQAEPVQTPLTQTEVAKQAERTQTEPAKIETEKVEPGKVEPAKIEAAKAEPATPRIPDLALANAPAPLAPADAPIRTAMLAPTEAEPAAIADPAVAITGPIPLPRSREWALAQSHATHRQPARKQTAAVRTRPRPVVRQQIRPATQPPAGAPNLLFPFGQ